MTCIKDCKNPTKFNFIQPVIICVMQATWTLLVYSFKVWHKDSNWIISDLIFVASCLEEV